MTMNDYKVVVLGTSSNADVLAAMPWPKGRGTDWDEVEDVAPYAHKSSFYSSGIKETKPPVGRREGTRRVMPTHHGL